MASCLASARLPAVAESAEAAVAAAEAEPRSSGLLAVASSEASAAVARLQADASASDDALPVVGRLPGRPSDDSAAPAQAGRLPSMSSDPSSRGSDKTASAMKCAASSLPRSGAAAITPSTRQADRRSCALRAATRNRGSACVSDTSIVAGSKDSRSNSTTALSAGLVHDATGCALAAAAAEPKAESTRSASGMRTSSTPWRTLDESALAAKTSGSRWSRRRDHSASPAEVPL